MSLHQILETLIHHTTFRTEAEQHQALDLLDETVDHEDPAEGAVARTDWKVKPPLDASGQPIPVPTGMTSAQADELISLLKSQQANIPSAGPSTPVDHPPDSPASPLSPPISSDDVPDGVK